MTAIDRGSSGVPYSPDDIFLIVYSNLSSQTIFNPSIWILIAGISLKRAETLISLAKSTFVAWKMQGAAFDGT